MFHTSTCGISDETQNAEARQALGAVDGVRACRGFALLYFFGYRREGVIEIPEDCQPNTVEAVMVHDNTGHEIPAGTRMMCHPKVGIYFHVNDVRLCRVPESALLLVEMNE